MADWEQRVEQLASDWEKIFKEQLDKLPGHDAGIPREIQEDPPWINVDGSSTIWAYRIVPIGEYRGLGLISASQFHLWFYRSGKGQGSPRPRYPYHKHAYVGVPESVIEEFLTAPSYTRAFQQLILGPEWKNMDAFRTNQSNGACRYENFSLSPDS